MSHTDTAIVIAETLLEGGGIEHLTPDMRGQIAAAAKRFDSAWDALTQAAQEVNELPWDLEIVPELVYEFPPLFEESAGQTEINAKVAALVEGGLAGLAA